MAGHIYRIEQANKSSKEHLKNLNDFFLMVRVVESDHSDYFWRKYVTQAFLCLVKALFHDPSVIILGVDHHLISGN